MSITSTVSTFFSLIFSASPCCKPAAVGLRGEYLGLSYFRLKCLRSSVSFSRVDRVISKMLDSLQSVLIRMSFSPRSIAPVKDRPNPLSWARRSCDQPFLRRRSRTRSPRFLRTITGSCIRNKMSAKSASVYALPWVALSWDAQVTIIPKM